MTITYQDEINGLPVKIEASYIPPTSEPPEASIRAIKFMGGDIRSWVAKSRPLELSRLRSECLDRCLESLDEMFAEHVNNSVDLRRNA
jgi:hypothetical protein